MSPVHLNHGLEQLRNVGKYVLDSIYWYSVQGLSVGDGKKLKKVEEYDALCKGNMFTEGILDV